VINCKLPSPCKGVKGEPKRKKDKELLAQRTAEEIAGVDSADHRQKMSDRASARTSARMLDSWDFVQPLVVTDEYMDSVYQCISSI
jgi:hypothetical protein|tara:strand:+ start:122 stop:379 length:258 start_codon:yes stop_codon:yes gene_type:complete